MEREGLRDDCSASEQGQVMIGEREESKLRIIPWGNNAGRGLQFIALSVVVVFSIISCNFSDRGFSEKQPTSTGAESSSQPRKAKPVTDSSEFVEAILAEAGVQMQKPPKGGISDDQAQSIMDSLISVRELRVVLAPDLIVLPIHTILFDYGERGKTLSIQRQLRFGTICHFKVTIDRPDGIRLRHKIEIGTDMAKWEQIRKETNWPEDKPFKRTYLLVQRDAAFGGRIEGKAYFEGAKAELTYSGSLSDEVIAGFEKLAWLAAQRLESVYEESIKPISEGPLFENNPVLTRPDLPDPDVK